MKPTRYKWLITNGELGTLDQRIVRYSLHTNGRRALINAIQNHADQTRRPSYAQLWEADGPTGNRWYPRQPRNGGTL